MSATWYLVQFTRELRRQEPRNVGVLLNTPDDGWLTRFLGETTAGDINGNSLRHLHASAEVYKSWVDYYRRKTAADDFAGVERMQRRRRGNFTARPGGTILERRSPTWAATLDRLYQELVEAEASTVVESSGESRANHLLDAAERVLTASGVSPERRVRVEARYDDNGPTTTVPFEFSYTNGQKHLMDLVHPHLTPGKAESDARELRARMDATYRAGTARSFVAFYASSLLHGVSTDILLPVEKMSETVDVDEVDGAVAKIRTLMTH